MPLFLSFVCSFVNNAVPVTAISLVCHYSRSHICTCQNWSKEFLTEDHTHMETN